MNFREITARLWVNHSKLVVGGEAIAADSGRKAEGGYVPFHQYRQSLPQAKTPGERRTLGLVDSDDSSDDGGESDTAEVTPAWLRVALYGRRPPCQK